MIGASHLAVALDVPDAKSALRLADQLAGTVGVYKVGLELFTAEGPAVAREIAQRGRLFLDLKLHDIPHTVEAAARAAARMGASYLTVHASGGRAMVEAAVRGAGPAVKVLAVTVLTSLGPDDLAAVGLAGTPSEAALRLARLAIAAGAQGLVCSAAEVASLRAEFPLPPGAPMQWPTGEGKDPVILVVPGIRPAGTDQGDQKRTGTPRETMAAGANLLVVGRPIYEAENPRAAALAIAKEIAAED